MKRKVEASAHRIIQLSRLLDTLQSKARQARKASENLGRILNAKGAEHYKQRALRLEGVAQKCSVRLQIATSSLQDGDMRRREFST